MAGAPTPKRGGKDGVLLSEVAGQRFANPDPRPAVSQAAALEWTALLAKPRPFDLDTPIGDGMPTTREGWVKARAEGRVAPGSGGVWSRIEVLSGAFPVLVAGADRTDVDHPAADTGLTRPSETAVSRGVEAFLAAYERGGLAEAAVRTQACWAEPRPPSLPMVKWRWQLERCAAMDIAASGLDETMSAKLNGPRMQFFMDEQVGERLLAFRPFVRDGLKPEPYFRGLRRSVFAWMPIQYAIRVKG